MKEMTTAEFAKANLAGLGEPVSVRRYTKVIGTYYPDGFMPGPQLALDEKSIIDVAMTNAATTIKDLELEVARLKRLLAARPEPVAVVAMTKDPFAGLPQQDRDFFERKLGSSKK